MQSMELTVQAHAVLEVRAVIRDVATTVAWWNWMWFRWYRDHARTLCRFSSLACFLKCDRSMIHAGVQLAQSEHRRRRSHNLTESIARHKKRDAFATLRQRSGTRRSRHLLPHPLHSQREWVTGKNNAPFQFLISSWNFFTRLSSEIVSLVFLVELAHHLSYSLHQPSNTVGSPVSQSGHMCRSSTRSSAR